MLFIQSPLGCDFKWLVRPVSIEYFKYWFLKRLPKCEKYLQFNWKFTYLVLFCRPYHRKNRQMDGDSHVLLIHELYNLFYQWKPYHNLCIYAFSLRNVLKYVDSNIVENWKLLHKWHIWNPKKKNIIITFSFSIFHITCCTYDRHWKYVKLFVFLLQTFGRSWWTIAWLSRASFRLKVFEQISHMYGASPVCFLSWICNISHRDIMLIFFNLI